MVILFGGSGFVGSSFLTASIKCNFSILSVSQLEVDYYDAHKLRLFLLDKKASFVINAAGFTGQPNVDACETAKYECLRGNSVLPGIIREVCEELRIPWGHVSSGCIYSGRRSDGAVWTEEDEPNFSFQSPNSFYSRTKALGEEVLECAENCFV